MIDNNATRTGSNNTLYFIVGGLVVLAGIGIFLYTNGYFRHTSSDVNVTVEQPATTTAPAAPATGTTTTE